MAGATGRFVAKVSLLPLLPVSLLMAVVLPGRRILHDLVSGTQVRAHPHELLRRRER